MLFSPDLAVFAENFPEGSGQRPPPSRPPKNWSQRLPHAWKAKCRAQPHSLSRSLHPSNRVLSRRKIDTVPAISGLAQKCRIQARQGLAHQKCAPSYPQLVPSRSEIPGEIWKKSVLAGLSAVTKASQEGELTSSPP